MLTLKDKGVTFDMIDSIASKPVYMGKRRARSFQIVGKFEGYDGKKYEALIKLGLFNDRSYLLFDNFIKNYCLVEDC